MKFATKPTTVHSHIVYSEAHASDGKMLSNLEFRQVVFGLVPIINTSKRARLARKRAWFA